MSGALVHRIFEGFQLDEIWQNLVVCSLKGWEKGETLHVHKNHGTHLGALSILWIAWHQQSNVPILRYQFQIPNLSNWKWQSFKSITNFSLVNYGSSHRFVYDISLAFQGTTFMASQPNRCAGTDPYQVCWAWCYFATMANCWGQPRSGFDVIFVWFSARRDDSSFIREPWIGRTLDCTDIWNSSFDMFWQFFTHDGSWWVSIFCGNKSQFQYRRNYM